jgi:PEP-CTERM/exosortase A-associated glycosyltransferase
MAVSTRHTARGIQDAGVLATRARGPVLHVFDHSFPKNDGYAFRSAEIIRFLHRSGWRTAHVTSAKQGPSAASLETVDGLDFHRTQPRHIWPNLPVVGQYAIVSGLTERLTEVVRHERPALLHVHSPCLNGLAALRVARRFDLPIIYEVRALWEDGAVDSGACREGDVRYRLSRMLETYVCRHVDHVVTICQGLRAELIQRGLDRGRITVAPNSVDLDHFSFTRARNDAEAARLDLTPGRTFGFVGSFFPFEGLDVLMRAVPIILAREPRARFVLVGDGADAARIRALVRELGIEHAVVLTGRVPHAEVVRYYDLMDVLVYPRVSNRVTELVTPLKPLEAMARRKLVVASAVGGHREMVFPGRNGVLFKAGDAASLADACLQLLARPQDWDRLRANGRTYVREARSWSRNVSIYDRLYRQMLAGRAWTS